MAIDGCKRLYAVDANDEIKRIRAQKCMNKDKDYPKFMKFTHKIQTTRNGNERPYKDIVIDKKKLRKRIDDDIICPMNWMQEYLDGIQGISTVSCIETSEFMAERPKVRINNSQMSKIRKIIEDYDAFAKYFSAIGQGCEDDDEMRLLIDKSEEVYEMVSKIRINGATMHRLIESALGYDTIGRKDKKYTKATRYTLKTLNVLYHANKELFLQCFVPKIVCLS